MVESIKRYKETISRYHCVSMFKSSEKTIIHPKKDVNTTFIFYGKYVHELLIDIDIVMDIPVNTIKITDDTTIGEKYLSNPDNILNILESLNELPFSKETDEPIMRIDINNCLVNYMCKTPNLSYLGWITPIHCIYHQGMIQLGKRMFPLFIFSVFHNSCKYPLCCIKLQHIKRVINEICTNRMDELTNLIFSCDCKIMSKNDLVYGLFGLFIYDLVTTRKKDLFDDNIKYMRTILQPWFYVVLYDVKQMK